MCIYIYIYIYRPKTVILDVFVNYFLLGLNQSEGSYHILQFLAPSQYLVKFVFANCNRETNQIVEFFHP